MIEPKINGEENIRFNRLTHEHKRKTKFKKFFNKNKRAILYIFLIIWLIVSLYPFLWSIIASFNNYNSFDKLGVNPIPHKWTLENYNYLFGEHASKFIGKWLKNSIIFSVSIATLNVVFNFLAGYALARIKFKEKKLLLWYLIAGTTIPAQITQLPQLIILIHLGTIGSQASDAKFFMGIIFTGMTSATWVFMARQYFLNIGVSAEEAGKLDGLSTFGVFWKIALRQLVPLIALMWTMVFMAGWNNFIMFTIWSGGSTDRMNLTAGLKTISGIAIGDGNPPQFGQMIALTATNIAVIPIIAVYMISLLFQRKSLIEGEK